MTKAVFYLKDGVITRFVISGHTTDNDCEQGRLVCAVVSSAIYLTANTVTDVIFAKADITERDGFFDFILKDKFSECNSILKGLKLHLTELSKQYKNFIEITTEVQHDA
ncbi:MAG: ribosomal-processing cysteine protease Prp [Acutalibacteraceae bacterium]|nr:ribosomal-processing cysteine protease Prp [Acutalibacteraceae bacterium]